VDRLDYARFADYDSVKMVVSVTLPRLLKL